MNFRELKEKDITQVEKIYDLYWPVSNNFRKKLSLKLKEFINRTEKVTLEDVHYYILEEDEEVLGAVSFRKCPDSMLQYANTDHPLEIYILATKVQGKGLGKLILKKALAQAKEEGYTEAILYNSDSHQESRGFYRKFGFEDLGSTPAPDGEPGAVFRHTL